MLERTQESTVSPGSIVMVAVALMAIGIVMVASTSVTVEHSFLGANIWRSAAIKQIFFVVLGLGMILGLSRVGPWTLASPPLRRRVTQVFFILTVVCLLAALLPGFSEAHRGSNRWIRIPLGSFTLGFQPSEVAKLSMVALVASLLSERRADPRSFRQCFIPASLVIGVCVLLVGKEDFGTSVLLASVGGVLLFVAGCRLRHLTLVGVVGAGGLVGLLYAAPYRLERLAAFKDIWADPQGAGYQPLQSLATIASGGWFGVGLGSGIQKYGYLPESHTDFVFASICEEMGLLGGMAVIGLFCVLMYMGYRVIMTAPSRFERLLAFGLTLTIGLQVAMNIAVVTVVAPTTGISLPLISAGGSGVVATCAALGVLCAIAARASAVSREEVTGSTVESRPASAGVGDRVHG